MKITTNWLKDHLDTKLNENQIIDKLELITKKFKIIGKYGTIDL